MRLNHIKGLIEVDLLQSNRQNTTGDRAQKMEKKNIYWRVAFQNLMTLLLFGVLFGSVLSNLPLADYPGIFSETIAFMVLFSVLQIYQSIFSLFYDQADLNTFLSMPFSLGELFLSKFITILLASFAYFISPLILMTVLGEQTGHSLILSFLIGLISTLLIMLGTILFVLFILHIVHQWAFFRKYKRFFMIGLYVLFFGFLLVSIYGNDTGEVIPGVGIVDSEVNPMFVGFHEVFISRLRLNGWLKIGLWFIGVALLSYATFKWIIPQLYFEKKQSETDKKTNKEQTKAPSLSGNTKWQVFTKYQIRQLSDTTLILQMLFSKFYLPFIMIAPMLFSEAIVDLTILETIPHLWGSYLLIGAAIGFIMMGESSVSGVIISFDKENYYYIQSLPLSFRGYLKFKFHFAFLIEWILGALAIIGVSFFLKLQLLPLFLILMGYSVGTYATSLYYFMRDYRLLDLTWNNFTELMHRGVSQVVRIFLQIILIFIGALAIGAFLFWYILVLGDSMRLAMSIAIGFVLILLVLGLRQYAEKKFWSQFHL